MLAHLLVAILLGPAGDAPDSDSDAASDSDSDSDSASDPDDPYAVQAPLDVETILNDSGRPYLDAWGRLEQHPALAAEALLDRLAAIPALGPIERKRLLDILAGLERPEHVPMFAKELRQAVVTADDVASAEVAADQWRALLTDQGEVAAPHLQALVGDRDIPISVRAKLLEDLVSVTSAEHAGELIVLMGRGHRKLRRTLRSQLVERAKREPQTAAHLRKATDTALDELLAQAEGDERSSPRATALIWFRAHIAEPSETAVVQRLQGLSEDDDEAFALRVAALRGLGRLESKAARGALADAARRELSSERRRTQRGEILGWIALRQLPPKAARPIVDELKLRDEPAPRLASMGYELGTLPRSGPWLTTGLSNAWPQVRQAALSRIEGPCSEDDLDRLAKLGGPVDKGGDSDGAVARAATQALGRCGGDEAWSRLTKQLKNDDAPMEQRAEAGRQLIKYGGPEGLDAVAKVLHRGDLQRALVRRLAASFRFAEAPTDDAAEALCGRLDDGGEVALAAAQSLRKLYAGTDINPCVEE